MKIFELKLDASIFICWIPIIITHTTHRSLINIFCHIQWTLTYFFASIFCFCLINFCYFRILNQINLPLYFLNIINCAYLLFILKCSLLSSPKTLLFISKIESKTIFSRRCLSIIRLRPNHTLNIMALCNSKTFKISPFQMMGNMMNTYQNIYIHFRTILQLPTPLVMPILKSTHENLLSLEIHSLDLSNLWTT